MPPPLVGDKGEFSVSILLQAEFQQSYDFMSSILAIELMKILMGSIPSPAVIPSGVRCTERKFFTLPCFVSSWMLQVSLYIKLIDKPVFDKSRCINIMLSAINACNCSNTHSSVANSLLGAFLSTFFEDYVSLGMVVFCFTGASSSSSSETTMIAASSSTY